MTMMKTARIHEFGDASVIRYDAVPRPRPAFGEVLIRVAATSFNPTEAALRAGMLQAFLPVDLPYTLGWDVAGTVAEIGAGAQGFAVGDRVIGWLDSGGAAEYVRAPVAVLVAVPDAVPLANAAALPLAGLTAWQAVFEHGKVAAGQRVLVNGAGGGIGGFVTQLAKYAGAEVIATAGARSAEAVRRQGADRVIDYTAGPVGASLDGPVDTLLNLVPLSPPDAAALAPLVRPGGRIVSIATPVESPADAGVTAMHMVARNDVARLAALVELVEAGAVAIDISESRPLTDLADVHRLSEAGRTRGKVIIIP
ncbi:NADP-dependent oxidoreductase [Streptomyces sp. NBC_00873]|uniref:NADP-dependent oxidoreductase n=1 Tax=unclassified Streptomyces TaxID=2593676 RepID=UPI00386870EC|nr:NADP-dependent oxidoreductase [Streptomyces sp. NBC_00873]WSY96834.1 NADP-dependent oxidoreductase [Streptomyces sp. NBC_00873]WTA41393.1 NADP-dependent oxidoreductase [Streptomyces sp. NBC_00842]WTA48504.1 NADP-dependent oxidoreductase [Streptomyces sp. NBC_00842]